MVAVASLFASGCSDGKPWVDKSLNEATVTGVVTVRGKPADGGKILFNGNSSGRSVPIKEAKIGPDGSYTITAYTGVNQVSFDGEVAQKNRGVGLVKESCEVKSGQNTANFDLLGEGGKKIPFPMDMNKSQPKRRAGS
jgi:hypothetical protein